MKNRVNTDDVRLIKRIQAGDKRAFHRFIEKYQQLVCHVVFRMVSNREDREDVCQDVFLKAYQNIAGFRFECKMSTWIAKIAFNTSVNYLQKKKVPLLGDHFVDEKSFDSFSSDSVLPDIVAEKKDIVTHLEKEMNRMDVPSRTVLTFYHLDGMRYNEIAQVMNLPLGTVKSILFRARKHLKERLMATYKKEELWHVHT